MVVSVAKQFIYLLFDCKDFDRVVVLGGRGDPEFTILDDAEVLQLGGGGGGTGCDVPPGFPTVAHGSTAVFDGDAVRV